MQLASSARIPDGFMAAMRLGGEKPHQGLPGRNPALYLGPTVSNSTTALGLRGQAELNHVGSRCTGKERDTESGNDYFGARYYSSAMGRFMSPDWSAKIMPVPYAVLGDPQSLNLYAYVRNNPVTRLDIDGHWEVDLLKKTTTYADGHTSVQYSFQAKPTKDGDNGATLAGQLGLKGKAADSFAKGVGSGPVELSKMGGTVGSAFGRMEGIMNSPQNAFRDCSQTAADIGYGGSHPNMSTGGLDRLLSQRSSAESGANATSGDIVRYGNSANQPEHFASFMYRDDSGNPWAFSKSGTNGGPIQYGPASGFQGVRPGGVDYGTIRGVNPGESGYYRPE
jgi:RHS repeat-associated protein